MELLPETWLVTMLIDAIQLDWDATGIQMENIQEQNSAIFLT